MSKWETAGYIGVLGCLTIFLGLLIAGIVLSEFGYVILSIFALLCIAPFGDMASAEKTEQTEQSKGD